MNATKTTLFRVRNILYLNIQKFTYAAKNIAVPKYGLSIRKKKITAVPYKNDQIIYRKS